MTESIEIWKDIEGYEGLYQVSSLGRVRSLPRKGTSGKILRPGTNTKGYLFVILYKDGKTKCYKVHRLVAQAFVPNDDPEHKTQVNHINDEDKSDNRVSNLNWMSPKENLNWGSRNKRASQKLKNHPNESKPVKQLTLDGTLVAIWPSTQEAERNGFKHTHIGQCCNGKRKTHKGYLWAYLVQK